MALNVRHKRSRVDQRICAREAGYIGQKRSQSRTKWKISSSKPNQLFLLKLSPSATPTRLCGSPPKLVPGFVAVGEPAPEMGL